MEAAIIVREPSPPVGEGALRVSEGRMRGRSAPHPSPSSLLRIYTFSHQGRRGANDQRGGNSVPYPVGFVRTTREELLLPNTAALASASHQECLGYFRMRWTCSFDFELWWEDGLRKLARGTR